MSSFFSKEYVQQSLPLVVFFAILIYDFWIALQHETLETGVLNVISIVVNTVPWVFTLYWLCKWNRQGWAWLVLIPKFFVGIFGGYIALRFLGRFRKESEENREVTNLTVRAVENREENKEESKEDGTKNQPRMERTLVHTADASTSQQVSPGPGKKVRKKGG